MMVRINLLPGKKRGASGTALWRLVSVMAVLFLAELIFLYTLYDSKESEVKKRQQELSKLQGEISLLEAQVAALPNLEAEARELERREQALAQLAAVRMGPQHLLDELQRLLIRPRTKPAIKQAKRAQWNVAWEAENIFLERLYEEADGLVFIKGNARAMDDVAEFWLRLRSSKLFKQVRLVNIQEERAHGMEIDLLSFVFSVRANFYYQTKDGVALMEQLSNNAEGSGAESPKGGE